MPTPSLCMNTSAPNVMSHLHHSNSLLGGTSSGMAPIQHSGNPLNSSILSGGGGGGGSSGSNPLNSSHTHNVSLPTNINNPNISFASNNAITQPASPMDTSASYKD